MGDKLAFELEQLVYHLFLPPKLPQAAHTDEQNDHINARLCQLITAAVKSYRHLVSDGDAPQWISMTRMLDNLSRTVSSFPSKSELSGMLLEMSAGADVLALHIREQNSAVLVRRQEAGMDFEVFEVQPPTADVMSTPGKLVRSYPGCAARIPNDIATNSDFTEEVANFLVQMDIDMLDDSVASTKRAGSTIDEVRDSAHPHFIANLFIGILRGLGTSIEPKLIVKRIADEVCWKSAYKPWRRSPLWLVMRVAMQTSLGPKSYKNFLVFFLCQVLRSCLKVPEFSGELLYAMRIKLARRVYKVQASIPIIITSIMENYFQVAQDVLQKRWNQIQSEHAHRLDWQPKFLDIKGATNLSIPTLYPYLQSVFDRITNAPEPHKPTFDPPNPLANVTDFNKFDDKALSKAILSHKLTALFDFEQSVQQNLSGWTTQNLTSELTPTIISSCITQYLRAAKEFYVHDKMDQSRMGLTIMELWMALDRSVTALYPLMLEYSPEIPKGYLEPLLLSSSQGIERANMVEQYLVQRHANAGGSSCSSIFSARTSKNAFSVHYFRQSPPLQMLKQSIEQKAREKRGEKIKEMDRLNKEHSHLIDQAKSSVCLQLKGKKLPDKQTHRKECTKCASTRKANKMKIKLYEWPLPEDDLEAEMVVFELQCPKPISLWRDMTHTILHNVGEAEVSDPVSPLCYLDKYDGLLPWSTELKTLNPRIGQASSIKSFIQSHYHTVRFPTSEGKVCVNNSLRFQPYDSVDKRWVSSPTNSTLAKCGTFDLPDNNPYTHLSYSLGGTTHTSNEVIASQFECPPELSLHEHIAFGSLRSGPHLQWLNILRGMEEGILRFGRYEVNLLHTQAAWQLGPLSKVTYAREWHVELAKAEFAEKLVSFALNSANQGLIIQARAGATTLELIPPSKLEEDFPSSFSSDFHHWLNIREKCVEFRPLSKPWSPDNQSWKLCVRDCGLLTMTSTMSHETCSLLDIRSPTYKAISQQLSGLETRKHIHITYSPSSQTRVNLPRFHLSFVLNGDKQLESLNFPGQVVDREQSSGTMIGISSQLVLRRHGSLVMEGIPRMVIIPDGNVIFTTHGHHVKVVIDTGADHHIGYHHYNIDPTLGCLSSSSELTSRLFRIYLHALTSYCLADPLTQRTGTEEALQLLSEPATSSFDRLDDAQTKLLGLIGKLTPQRTYYPIHRKCMQSTIWLNLPMFSQHDAFIGYAESIISHADQLKVFHPNSDSGLNQYLGKSSEGALYQRATLRNTQFYPADTPEILKAFSQKDNLYFGRDAHRPSSKWSTQEDIASWATGLAKTHWVHPAYTFYNLAGMLKLYGICHGVQQGIRLSYDPQWLSISLESWLSIYDVCRRAHIFSRSPFALAFCISAAAYTDGLSPELALTLISIATNPEFRRLQPPEHAQYNLQDGYKPTHAGIKELVLGCLKTPIGTVTVSKRRRAKKKKTPQQQVPLDNMLSVCATKITELALSQWPNYHPGTCALFAENFDMEKCNGAIRNYFASCSRNLDLRNHLNQVQKSLPDLSGIFNVNIPTTWLAAKDLTQLTKHSWDQQLYHDYPPNFITLLLSRDPPLANAKSSPPVPLSPVFVYDNGSNSTPNTEILEKILREFTQDETHLLNRRYGGDLDISRRSFLATHPASSCTPTTLLSELYLHLDGCDKDLSAMYHMIAVALAPLNIAERLLASSGIWPRLSPRNILKKLGLHYRVSMPQSWMAPLADYALKFIALQRATRLIHLGADNRHEEIRREIDGIDKNNTLSHKDLDWILIQIEGNFSIRELQAQIALEMTSPSSGENSLMQLNMGEGKSSVIIPVVAATLAKGRTLVRVVVIKPLWRAMFHLLVTRLGGLAHRKIYYLPFGRHIQPSMENAQIIQSLYTECMHNGGIILAQPEHILSFKLMSINQLMSERGLTTNHLYQIQSWLDSNSRDILDESDEILNVKYQLVYTVGMQEPLEGHPNRWRLAEELLHLAAQCLHRLKSRFPSISICDHLPGGRFPLLKIGPNPSVVLELMMTMLANDILDGRLASLNPLHFGHNAREATFLFLTKRELTSQAQDFLKAACDPSMWTGLLLLRGLLACGILAFVLRDKYYRVNYGLDLNRSLLAVPYIAKDVPSLRAEFGHPDVTILLTCLSYYYQGLSEAQLASCFEMIYKTDNPALEYDHWVLQGGGVPQEYSTLQGINIQDVKQFQQDIVPLFSYNSAVINFYLSALVFPRSVKEFPHKLVSSAWDLAATKAHPTTGFSGTNDNRYLLPTSIAQVDPLGQAGTNALLLNLLLQPENDYYQCVQRNGEMATARSFIDSLALQRPTIDVLLDVGAQMLDMTNEELARYWLSLRPDALAAVYFNDNDELLVLSQDEGPSRLITSPFAQRLDQCIVYLDDSHTRGTDLKLPRDARGAVTLGPKVTKDRLAQGCMRMRKLGRSQSVMFFAPFEIDSQIRQAVVAPEYRTIQTYDVLRWAMLSTCNDLKHQVGHWVQQGQDYGRRLWHEEQYRNTRDARVLERGWLQKESRSVEKLYGAVNSSTMIQDASILENPKLYQRLKYLGIDNVEDSGWDEQQEREVSHEIELERQIERPLPVRAAKHSIHKDILEMVETGYFPRSSPALCSLLKLSQPVSQNPYIQKGHLFATVDFVTAIVQPDSSRVATSLMRPINWILSGNSGDIVALSPYEANALLPQIRSSSAVILHVYAPRVTNHMVTFSDLKFYHLSPPSIIRSPGSLAIDVRIQLILSSGQLYLDDYQQYLAVCAFLGLYVPNSDDDPDFVGKFVISSDGFIGPAQREKLVKYRPEYASCRFKSSPVSMLRDLVGKRRMGMDYMRTHLGQILHGRLLTPADFN
ncbi:unnamed protein product [Rhizoctonia solani]|uniref:ubiquitinyl hydrolase 1 n=1 Tax=Rhizoctonia solani TaxID=456999 RepID=A0A8H3DKV5_9AGAM|nr:unnamed protein product [Rhizoctonia solani]